MNFVLISLLFPLYLTSSQASVPSDQVVRVIPGKTQSEETLFFLASGRVLRSTDQKVIRRLEQNFEISFLTDHPILDRYRDYDLPSLSIASNASGVRYTDPDFVPTELKSVEDADQLMSFLQLNSKSKSQCYQRAHLWSIEMLKMAGVNSQKIFLFFSTKYIREYRFDWWFHVAPFVLVGEQEYVLDPSFFDHPAGAQEWINFFMPSRPSCKTVFNYRDYEDHQEEQYCFLRKLPMYYFEPTQVENRDVKDAVIQDWIDEQVASAYASLANAPWWKR